MNESLNTLKGQISNVSNVMHDVFTEGILEEHTESTSEMPTTTTTSTTADEAATLTVPPKAVTPSTSSPNPIPMTSDDEILIGLEEANKKIDELNSLCETKDNEVSTRFYALDISHGDLSNVGHLLLLISHP